MVPFRRTSMEGIQRELRNAKVQQSADRTHVSIGVQQPNTLAPCENSCSLRQTVEQTYISISDVFLADQKARH